MKNSDNKLKLAIGLGATCSGCDIALLDIKEKILGLLEIADIIFWPTGMDGKQRDLEKMRDESIDIGIYHGSVRNSENEEIAKLIREKSKILIAFGSCACYGGIPGLANISNKSEIFEIVYKKTKSTVNPEFVTPQKNLSFNGRILSLPEFYDTVRSLDQTVEVDYYLPGCPPPVQLIELAISAIASGELPPKGSVIASDKSLCEECPREIEDKKISFIHRIYEIVPDQKRCLLEQGIICLGPATRGGCEAKCIKVNMPCEGCLGPLPNLKDQGSSILSAIASILAVEDEKQLAEDELKKLVEKIFDPLGTFYRFTLPVAPINRRVEDG
ncbi:MAG: oxidoreductase [Candidatus Hydrothermarchaeota archaeon]